MGLEPTTFCMARGSRVRPVRGCDVAGRGRVVQRRDPASTAARVASFPVLGHHCLTGQIAAECRRVCGVRCSRRRPDDDPGVAWVASTGAILSPPPSSGTRTEMTHARPGPLHARIGRWRMKRRPSPLIWTAAHLASSRAGSPMGVSRESSLATVATRRGRHAMRRDSRPDFARPSFSRSELRDVHQHDALAGETCRGESVLAGGRGGPGSPTVNPPGYAGTRAYAS
jgi:hypothetical protein